MSDPKEVFKEKFKGELASFKETLAGFKPVIEEISLLVEQKIDARERLAESDGEEAQKLQALIDLKEDEIEKLGLALVNEIDMKVHFYIYASEAMTSTKELVRSLVEKKKS